MSSNKKAIVKNYGQVGDTRVMIFIIMLKLVTSNIIA